MKGRKKPWNLPRLKPETEQAIADLIGSWAVSTQSHYMIHGRFLLCEKDATLLYHATNVYSALVWFIKSIHEYERDCANGVYDLENLPAETSKGEFNELVFEQSENHKQNLKLLRQIENVAKDAKDDAFATHLAFATSFAEDPDGDQCRRLAVADITRNPPPLGQAWTIDLIVDYLRIWHRINLDRESENDRKCIERDCKALKVRLKRGRPAKKTDD